MRIASITAGAAGMYCGSCMRDNTLAAALQRLGHDCVLLATYTPLRTDETDVSAPRIFLGGLNVYLEQKYPALRRMPGWLGRFLSARWLLRQVSRFAVETRAEDLADLTLSVLRGPEGYQAIELERLADWLVRHFQPDVILLTNVLLAGLVPVLRQRLGRPVVATLQGDDIFLEALPAAARQTAVQLIQRHCQQVTGYIVPCQWYGDYMAGYLGLPRDRMHVVYPGLNLAGFPATPRPGAGGADGRRLQIGYLARIAPEKGLHVLVEALGLLAQDPHVPPWSFTAAGYLAPHRRGYLEEQKRSAVRAGWADRFHYLGEPDHASKIAFLSGLDVFSAPAQFLEPKGLYVLEALACGVPVVQPRHGSFPELISATGGGLLVEPNAPEALATGLAQLLRDGELRQRLGSAGQAAVRERFTAEQMASATVAVLQRLVN